MPAPSDLVHETSTTTGTGNFTLSNANGKRSFNTAFGTGGTDVFDYYISNRDAAEWERGTGHLSAASTLVRDTVIASSNSNNAVNFSAGTKDLTNDVPAAKQAVLDAALPSRLPHGMDMPINLALAVSAAASALTIAIKGADGNDPSSTNPVLVPFRFAGTTGTPVWASITGANSLVLSSGSTLGVTSSTAFRIWVVLFNDASTYRLGAINCNLGTSGVYPLAEEGMISSTAEGGAGGADSAGVIYTGTAVTSKPYRILGYVEWNTSGLTAGTWTTTNLNVLNGIVLFTPGMKKPGDIVQRPLTQTGSSATGTTAIPSDNTIPQNTEGDQYMSLAITPTSAANHLNIRAQGLFAHSGGVIAMCMALFQDSTADALAAVDFQIAGANYLITLFISHQMRAGTASSTTFKIRAGGNSGSTTTFNGQAGSQLLGGVKNSFITIDEIMA